MALTRFPARHLHNPEATTSRAYGDGERRILNQDAFRTARAEITSWPGYAPTPLVSLPGLASALGIAHLDYKDEAHRFGLKSFKALGGAYAVLRVLQKQLADQAILGASAKDLIAGKHRDLVKGVTVAAATDGNHGRSVAWGARMFGCRCKIYLHAFVSQDREREIAAYGAEIVRTKGGYDDSVRQCAADAEARGWHLVADTNSGGGSAEMPTLVMQGYAIMVDELLGQLGGTPASHVFVQGGVGGLAAAVAGHLWDVLGQRRPRIVVVEPTKADCIYRSIEAGKPTPVPHEVDTFMACLAAGEIAPLAWPILRYAADDILTLPDEAAPAAMQLLADGIKGDPAIVAGESGCAATAGLIAAALDPAIKSALGIDANSRVVTIGSEGATDPATYRRTVGRTAENVAGGV